jgi:hypothetical protein
MTRADEAQSAINDRLSDGWIGNHTFEARRISVGIVSGNEPPGFAMRNGFWYPIIRGGEHKHSGRLRFQDRQWQSLAR